VVYAARPEADERSNHPTRHLAVNLKI